ncbi:eukaryotic translation initiation factor 3 subunit d [Anaeramoeba flamelloides]|uniref:Eukaryotic translation initiation factor 3 subunit d n=1 Tax=Anaeramoeba flamelloides TaxID=1746091 RepID=A0ABQ8Z162_9EUKA|nr:eukaryotic translation initiation factor 3 subunit d [Anaeramoeba flamelloides]
MMTNSLDLTEKKEHTWGPSSEELDDFPIPNFYNPFQKHEKLGKISDWMSYSSRQRYWKSNSEFNYEHKEKEYGAGLKKVKTRVGKEKKKEQNRYNYNRNNQQNKKVYVNWYLRNKKVGTGSFGTHGLGFANKSFHESWKIQPKRTWDEVTEFPLLSLNKLDLKLNIDKPVDLKYCGSLRFYKSMYDKISVNHKIQLNTYNKTFIEVNPSEDPILKKFSEEGIGNIFVTDQILSALMISPRSAIPWDIVFTKKGDQLWLDKRKGSRLDYETINETNRWAPSDDKPESVNSAYSLSNEATDTNLRFSQQVLSKSGSVEFNNKSPFTEEKSNIGNYEQQEHTSIFYRYRSFDLDDNMKIIVRCSINAAEEPPQKKKKKVNVRQTKKNRRAKKLNIDEEGEDNQEEIKYGPDVTVIHIDGNPPKKNEEEKETEENFEKKSIEIEKEEPKLEWNGPKLLSVHALNEVNPKYTINWKENLDLKMASALLTEMKNNANKMGKWGIKAHLAGVDQIKIGFVSRTDNYSNKTHTVCGVCKYTPQELLSFCSLNLSNAWSIVKTLCSEILALPKDGHYILLRTNRKSSLVLYQLSNLEFKITEEHEDKNKPYPYTTKKIVSLNETKVKLTKRKSIKKKTTTNKNRNQKKPRKVTKNKRQVIDWSAIKN